jgi:hypothetical protein
MKTNFLYVEFSNNEYDTQSDRVNILNNTRRIMDEDCVQWRPLVLAVLTFEFCYHTASSVENLILYNNIMVNRSL